MSAPAMQAVFTHYPEKGPCLFTRVQLWYDGRLAITTSLPGKIIGKCDALDEIKRKYFHIPLHIDGVNSKK